VAKIYPSDWKALSATGWLGRQLDTLRLLEAGLPSRYAVYHGVHWTRIADGGAVLGAIDFIVVSPAGRIALIEQKTGLLSETPNGLALPRTDQRGLVTIGMARSLDSLNRRLVAAFGEGSFHLEELLYCPDYTVRDRAIAGVKPERIVDAPRRNQLLRILLDLLPADEPVFSAAPRLHRFFSDLLELVPDTTALREQAADWVTRLSGGLASFARAIEMTPHRLRVIGTAGSGKTQLALRVLEDAQKRGARALYVCYNRPLADHISRIAPKEARVVTFHQLAEEVLRSSGSSVKHGGADSFRRLEEAFARLGPSGYPAFDVMVIDEGQDFANSWVGAIFRLGTPLGAIWWLEDPMQNLYARETVQLDGFVVLRAPTNFRSPRDLVNVLTSLYPDDTTFAAGSPFDGSGISVSSYDSLDSLKTATKRAITQALSAGFSKSEIAVLTFHGREHSQLLGLSALGPHRFRRFTGEYDLLGNPVYSEGEVLLESLYRFKGQAAPCVILTEVDLTALDDANRQKLFVGMTRATMKLMLIASAVASEILKPHFAAAEEDETDEADVNA